MLASVGCTDLSETTYDIVPMFLSLHRHIMVGRKFAKPIHRPTTQPISVSERTYKRLKNILLGLVFNLTSKFITL